MSGGLNSFGKMAKGESSMLEERVQFISSLLAPPVFSYFPEAV
jgi:hypothetical protein